MEIDKLYSSYFDEKKQYLPYENDIEYLSDMFCFLDVCLTVACSLKGLKGGSFPDPDTVGAVGGLSVSSEDLFSILLPKSEQNISEKAREQLENAFFHFESRTRKSIKNGFMPRFEAVCIKFGLSELERFAAIMALSTVYDRKYEGAYSYLHNNINDHLPSYWLIGRLWKIVFDPVSDGAPTADMLPSFSRFIVLPDTERSSRTIRGASSHRLVMRGNIASYILGRDGDDRELSEYLLPEVKAPTDDHIDDHNVPGRDITEQACVFFNRKAFSSDGCAVLNLYGSEGIGRRYTAGCAAAGRGVSLIAADMRRLLLLDTTNMLGKLDEIYVECVLKGAVPCFLFGREKEYTEDGERKSGNAADNVKLITAAEHLTKLFRFVFWISEEKESAFYSTDAEFLSIELPMLTAAQRRIFWDAFMDKSLCDSSVDLDIVSSQYILTPRDIRRAAAASRELAAAETSNTPTITKDIIRRGINQYSVNQLGHYATKINAVFTWDDLVIDEEQRRQMKMICDQVRYRSVVRDEWGFGKKTPYGGGLSALFYGSPGTGKTMAVQVMANELGLDLYRIDLSQMASKYIGETQKNISRLFERAKNINAMLFFDEADSMFAKRSEVKDSNDRYANADTAFLLQKLEDYNGITILATNYVNNIDDAFKRRIKFIINFVFPTADVRLTLWKSILPKTAKLGESIDFEFFAENFELSGSNIKETLTNAAYLAAAEGSGICNRHIAQAVKLNFSKYGKILTDEDFGYIGL